MKPDFASILSTLRHENNLSQKKAADDLGISQALLSHYENGVREPKLEFVVKACDYYGVSTDYILGRTAERAFGGVSLHCRTEVDKRNVCAASLIISMLSEIGDEALANAAARYMSFTIYIVLCALRLKRPHYEPVFDAAMKMAEAAFVDRARHVTADPITAYKLSEEALLSKYPEQYSAMLETEDIVKKAVAQLKTE